MITFNKHSNGLKVMHIEMPNATYTNRYHLPDHNPAKQGLKLPTAYNIEG